jgi:alpha-glucosidase
MKNSTIIFLIIMIVLASFSLKAQNNEITSPDGRILLKFFIDEDISYAVFFDGAEIIHPSEIAMIINNGEILGKNAKLKKSAKNEINDTILPVVREKRAEIADHCNELKLDFKGNCSLVFRVYNDGVAYRWMTGFKEEITIVDEIVSFNLSENDSVYFPEEKSFLTHSERQYPFLAVKNITNDQMSCVPALVCREDGIRIAITESDLLDYPGMYLTGTTSQEAVFKGKFPPYPLLEKQTNDRTVIVEKPAAYIAKTQGTRAFPWRVMMITDNDAALVESDLVYRLASPNKIIDFFWIQPGKVAWDWFNALNIKGVDFESGLNTATYKYYIDFAAAYKIPYIILDEGWSATDDLLKVNPDIDLPELLKYAEQKNVGIILWVVWLTLDNQLQPALDQFQKWGVKGIKVDFMQRDDQKMVNYYEKVASEAAKRRLLVDFHGSYKPTGFGRTYPNVLTREGVHGLENNKWASTVTPEHNVTLPFTRMLAGPMDYTPGAMINCTQKQFHPIWDKPASQGTRCHQLAMYVVYESPLQMLADNPSNYYKEPESMEFLKEVPATWDETKVLAAKVADYIIVARKNDGKWYIGGMTDWTPREIEIDLSFLDAGLHQMKIIKDGANADKDATDLKVENKMVSSSDKMKINMAPGGGWVAIIE